MKMHFQLHVGFFLSILAYVRQPETFTVSCSHFHGWGGRVAFGSGSPRASFSCVWTSGLSADTPSIGHMKGCQERDG